MGIGNVCYILLIVLSSAHTDYQWRTPPVHWFNYAWAHSKVHSQTKVEIFMDASQQTIISRRFDMSQLLVDVPVLPKKFLTTNNSCIPKLLLTSPQRTWCTGIDWRFDTPTACTVGERCNRRAWTMPLFVAVSIDTSFRLRAVNHK